MRGCGPWLGGSWPSSRDTRRKGAGCVTGGRLAERFALTQDEIVQAIRVGSLHYRLNSVYENPFLRLLRKKVEALVKAKHGNRHLKDRQADTGVGAHRARAEAAEGPDHRVGKAEVKRVGEVVGRAVHRQRRRPLHDLPAGRGLTSTRPQASPIRSSTARNLGSARRSSRPGSTLSSESPPSRSA